MERSEHKLAEAPLADGGEHEPAKLLLVGGDPDSRTALIGLLEKRRHQCDHVSRLDEAQAALARDRYDLILLNRALPDGDGLDLAPFVQKTSPATKTIVFSRNGSFKCALQAMRCGAVDCVSTPVDPDELIDRIDSALARSREERQRESDDQAESQMMTILQPTLSEDSVTWAISFCRSSSESAYQASVRVAIQSL